MYGLRLEQFPGMPIPPELPEEPGQEPCIIARQLAYDRDYLQQQVDIQKEQLNDEQRHVYNTILAAVPADDEALPQSRAFFLDAPGGCGKTFMFNLLLATIRAQGRIALSVASSGIAALLLTGGTTAHSLFKISFDNLTEETTCGATA